MVPQSLHTSKLSAVGGQWSVVSNGNGNTFVHEGPRRTTKNGNVNTFVRGGARRTATATPLSAKGREGARRTATATPLSAEGREGTAEDGNVNTFVRGGARRTATATSLIREGTRRTAGKHRGTAGVGGWQTAGRPQGGRGLIAVRVIGTAIVVIKTGWLRAVMYIWTGFGGGRGHPQGVPLPACAARGGRATGGAGTLVERGGTVGEARADTGRQFRIAHTLATTRGCRRGGVAGAEPPHNCSGQ